MRRRRLTPLAVWLIAVATMVALAFVISRG
jgi:hypothetical protein